MLSSKQLKKDDIGQCQPTSAVNNNPLHSIVIRRAQVNPLRPHVKEHYVQIRFC